MGRCANAVAEDVVEAGMAILVVGLISGPGV